MLAGIYYGSAYGGSTTSILVNLPGETSSAVTCIDGYQMARQGRAGPALAIAAIGSFVAGTIGTALIIVAGPAIASIALKFRAPEYATLIVFALVATAALARGGLVKGIGVAMLGILFGTVGTDLTSGRTRFAFDLPQLYEGISFVIVAVGFFALSEIIMSANDPDSRNVFKVSTGSLMPSRRDMRDASPAILRGTAIGSFFGVLPGAGVSIAAFAAYMLEKTISRTPDIFGKGAIQGVAAPESANNAASQTAFIPTLTLVIPGSPTMALMLGALMIQGIAPGPRVITDHPNLFWDLIVSMWIGNLMLLVLNLPLVGLSVRMLRIPYHWLYILIMGFACMGVFSVNMSGFDLYVAAFFGVLGFLTVKCGCSPALFILGLVFGPMLEEYFRRALLISNGDFSVFVTSPISLCFLLLAVGTVAMMVIPGIRRRSTFIAQNADEA
ncbi:hypothetical protein GCM10011534_42380 [Pseudooceanicola nanhaiensis]|jgi:TctA family transporter|uniref:DUF112 domain-containing protein n=1 Tax=Pseudooceanicola nanhaiensis TaxID=375761 RepID=A0A917TA02_9RHOB|nr:tripartite tricarboxylate transporter permease [Pseudooceanicola nanhaiensis]GGM15941.1 hypothetical protein GCM10011534_42380 [Pseudooceanicola nanhaiensis]